MAEAFDPRQQLRRHLVFLQELGVAGFSRDPAWRHDGAAAPAVPAGTPQQEAPAADEPALVVPAVDPAAGADAPAALALLRDEIGPLCTRCKLAGLGRRQVVFGVGNPHAELMFVGEAPGADEDIQGEPFVGRAGQLLTKMIEAMGYTRESVYIANVVKCRPPANRTPEPDEVAACEPFLLRQIDIIQPKVVVGLGSSAARALLRTDTPISRLRGQVFPLRAAKFVPTFHPAYLLRSPDKKRDAWEDLKKVMALLREEA
jgi:uracil-DNA glycosylase family 4